MGLRDIQIPKRSVTYLGNKIEVRGITVADLMAATQDYGPQIALAFGKATSGDLSDADIKTHILSLSREVPEVVAATIALAADEYEPEMVDTAMKLPFGVQVELIEAIFDLTFTSEAEIKKLVESLSKLIAAASGALTTAMEPSNSQTGIGLADGK